MSKIFGKLPSGARLERILKSPNYKNGAFQNIEPTAVNPNKVSIFKMLRNFANKPKMVLPGKELPYVETDLKKLAAQKPTIVWFGHSSYFISMDGFHILIDPVFSGNVSPVKFFGKAFSGTDNYKAGYLPTIDILLITHDHYDHLDFKTIVAIDDQVKKVIAPLGVGAHLAHWGVAANKIVELDWWDTHSISPGIEFIATPARHFSGRGVTRGKTLWTSYVLKINGYKIFIGGDSGYDDQFKIIGNKFGSFDLAVLECGQYGEDWPLIHMLPEETVQAAKDLKADILFPVHWSKFTLSLHAWNEPIKRLAVSAEKEKQKFVAPMIGQPYTIGEAHQQVSWWDIE